MMIEEKLHQIGTVRSSYPEPADPFEMKTKESTITIDGQFSEGLYKLEENEYIDVIYLFHRSEEFELRLHTHSGSYKGVFASRSPKRPNRIALTRVRLLAMSGNELRVHGLDAVDGSPVLDVKPADFSIEENMEKDVMFQRIKQDPRREIRRLVRSGDREKLLILASQMHGHFCPGLAMGVMASVDALQKMDKDSDGLEELVVITETNNCMVDGLQFVTGCTVGNNSLFIKDLGKTAFTITDRSGKGYRYSARPDSREYMRKNYPEFSESYDKVVGQGSRDKEEVEKFKQYGREKSFATVRLDVNRIFEIKKTEAELPDYAPSHESINCERCGEPVMATRTVQRKERELCLDCAGAPFGYFDGHGIQVKSTK